MKTRILLAVVLAASLVLPQSATAQTRYKQKKYFGPIALNSFTFSVGFLDGPSADLLAEHLENWASLEGRNGEDYLNALGTSPYAQIGYERMISPMHFLSANLCFTYLKTDSYGNYYASEADTSVSIDISREFRVFYLSLDAGLGYYFVEPATRTLCPYVSGGFSMTFPMNKLTTDLTREETGEVFPNPGETVSHNSVQTGIHAEFGMKYYITNVWAAGIEGRYQMSQSKFDIHNANFDIDYAGLSLALKVFYNF